MSWQENLRVRQFLGEGSRQNHPHSKSKLTKWLVFQNLTMRQFLTTDQNNIVLGQNSPEYKQLSNPGLKTCIRTDILKVIWYTQDESRC